MTEALANKSGMEFSEGKEIDKKTSFGLIMVKPHAVREAADVTISSVLGATPDRMKQEMIKALNLPDDVEEKVFGGKLSVCKTIYRDLGQPSLRGEVQVDELMELFYGRDKEKRHYQTLLDLYSGSVVFFVVKYDGPQAELEDVLRKLKGKEEFFREERGSGIRGTLIPPKERIDLDELETLPEVEYRKKVVNVINNVVHITDNVAETAKALQILLTPSEIGEISNCGIPIDSFIARYAGER